MPSKALLHVAMTTLLPESIDPSKAIQSYQPGCIVINKVAFRHSLLLSSHGDHTRWRPQSMEDFQLADIQQIQPKAQRLLLIGTGNQQHLLPKPYKAFFDQHHAPYEVMHSLAACKTYNMMLADGRETLLAVLIL